MTPVRVALRVLLLAAATVVIGGHEVQAHHAPDHWGPRAVVVRDETGRADTGAALRHAVDAWDAAEADLELTVRPGNGNGCGDPPLGEIAVCGYDSSDAGEARRWIVDGHIVRAAVLIDADGLRPEYLRGVSCHELGHALGLDHREAGRTCMAGRPSSETPDQHDRDALRVGHDHRHGEDSCDGRHAARIGRTCYVPFA